MKSLFYSLIIAIVTFTAISCSSGDGNARNPKARELYLKSLKLAKAYTDSIQNARDSAEIVRLSKAYETALTNLNYAYPADLGLEISEGENDTLVKVTMRYVAVRDAKLKNIGYVAPAEIDSALLGSPEVAEYQPATAVQEAQENQPKKETKVNKENKEKKVNKESTDKKEPKEKKETKVKETLEKKEPQEKPEPAPKEEAED